MLQIIWLICTCTCILNIVLIGPAGQQTYRALVITCPTTTTAATTATAAAATILPNSCH